MKSYCQRDPPFRSRSILSIISYIFFMHSSLFGPHSTTILCRTRPTPLRTLFSHKHKQRTQSTPFLISNPSNIALPALWYQPHATSSLRTISKGKHVQHPNRPLSSLNHKLHPHTVSFTFSNTTHLPYLPPTPLCPSVSIGLSSLSPKYLFLQQLSDGQTHKILSYFSYETQLNVPN